MTAWEIAAELVKIFGKDRRYGLGGDETQIFVTPIRSPK